MNAKQKADVKFLIEFYESKGRDWSDALEFTVRRCHGTLPWEERMAALQATRKRVGRPRKQK